MTQRERNRGGFEEQTGQMFYYAFDGSIRTPSNPVTKVTRVTSEVMHDVVTPNFKKATSSGKVICSPMLHVTTDELTPFSSWNNTYVSNFSGGWSDIGDMNVVDFIGGLVHYKELDVNTAPYVVEVGQDTHAKVKLNEADIQIMIAEMGKTSQFITKAVRSFINVLRLVTKPRSFLRKVAGLNLKQISETYLELRYALRPLVIDIENAIKAARVIQKKPQHGDRRTSRASVTDYLSVEDTVSNNTRFQTVNCDIKRFTSVEVDVRGGCLWSIFTEGRGLPVSEVIGANNNPVELVWELIPWSFVVNWFLGVDKFIESRTLSSLIRLLCSWTVVKTVTTQTMTSTNVRSNGSLAQSGTHNVTGHFSQELVTTRIERIPALLLPPLPLVKVKLDGYKIADLSIFLTKFLRKFR